MKTKTGDTVIAGPGLRKLCGEPAVITKAYVAALRKAAKELSKENVKKSATFKDLPLANDTVGTLTRAVWPPDPLMPKQVASLFERESTVKDTPKIEAFSIGPLRKIGVYDLAMRGTICKRLEKAIRERLAERQKRLKHLYPNGHV